VTNLNLWTGSRIRKPEVVYKVLVKVRNDAEFTVIRKTSDKKVADKPEVGVYFGLLLV